jgi:hypothetical protein
VTRDRGAAHVVEALSQPKRIAQISLCYVTIAEGERPRAELM